MEAEDGDKSGTGLTYIILNEEASSPFTIDSEGYLFVERALDFEEMQEYILEVSVMNSEYLANETAHVLVRVENVNDEIPTFYECLVGCCEEKNVMSESLRILVVENLLPQWSVLNFSACDRDSSDLLYSLNNSSSVFNVEGGKLMIREPLDYEQHSSFQLSIAASDGALVSVNPLQVMVEVGNLNDNPLVFEEEVYEAWISENEDPGELIIAVSASDMDDPEANIVYTITEQVEDLPFAPPGAASPEATWVTNTEHFNYEDSQEWFIFNISAHCANNTNPLVSSLAESVVYVRVQDVNEFAPSIFQGSVQWEHSGRRVGGPGCDLGCGPGWGRCVWWCELQDSPRTSAPLHYQPPGGGSSTRNPLMQSLLRRSSISKLKRRMEGA